MQSLPTSTSGRPCGRSLPTPQVGDWVFHDVEFSFAENGDDEPDDPPDETTTQLLREWGLGPDKAWALHGALRNAGLSLQVTHIKEE
jgi:hypothetical protein